MDKHGADKIISVYWFAILFIVAAAIVYMVVSFYGEPYDVRELEADILADKVADCLAEGGYLKEGIFESLSNNLLETCNFNFEVEDIHNWDDDQLYVEIKIYNFSSKTKIFEISEGNINLKENCELEGNNFPFCLERSFYVIDKDNNQYQVNILSIVRKTEKNVQ